jgi:hypothetical protein
MWDGKCILWKRGSQCSRRRWEKTILSHWEVWQCIIWGGKEKTNHIMQLFKSLATPYIMYQVSIELTMVLKKTSKTYLWLVLDTFNIRKWWYGFLEIQCHCLKEHNILFVHHRRDLLNIAENKTGNRRSNKFCAALAIRSLFCLSKDDLWDALQVLYLVISQNYHAHWLLLSHNVSTYLPNALWWMSIYIVSHVCCEQLTITN